MKLTKKKIKEFIDLTKDYKNADIQKLSQYLSEHPELVNLKITGLAKGIDGFSSLMLAIRYLNFDFAVVLVRQGADVNYIDESADRYYHYPLFFDLIEMMKTIVEAENTSMERKKVLFGKALALWEEADAHGLDYTLTSPETEITDPENCLSAAIRLIDAGYGVNHRVHREAVYDPPQPYRVGYRFSEESRDREKEQLYKTILDRIVKRVDEKVIDSVDCRRHRSVSMEVLPFYEEHGYVDPFSLETANELVREKFGRDLPNYRGNVALESIGGQVKWFAGEDRS